MEMLPATVRTGTCVALLLAGMALAAVTARAVGPLHSGPRPDFGPPPLPPFAMGLPPAPPPGAGQDSPYDAPPPPAPPTEEQRSAVRSIRDGFAARFDALRQEQYAAWVALEAALTRSTPDADETARTARALREVTAKQHDLAIEMRQRIIKETGIRTPVPGPLGLLGVRQGMGPGMGPDRGQGPAHGPEHDRSPHRLEPGDGTPPNHMPPSGVLPSGAS
jgi:hypothetical protein